MKITISPTHELTTLAGVPCRRWEGATADGVRVVAFVAAIGVEDTVPVEQREAFERELGELLELGAPGLLVLLGPSAGGGAPS